MIRSLTRAPIFSATVVATLAIGMASVITLFSVTDAALLRPLPYRDSDRLVTVNNVLAADFRDIQTRNNAFDQMALYSPSACVLSRDGNAHRLTSVAVSPDFFLMLGVAPKMGRDFAATEFRPGNNHVVLLSHSLWVRDFASDPHVLGSSIVLNSAAYTVIGVLPSRFRWRQRWLDKETDIWLPLALNAAQLGQRGAPRLGSRGPTKDYYSTWILARLRRGVALPEAQRDFHTLIASLMAQHPEDKSLRDRQLYSIQFIQTGPVGDILWPLLGGTAFILLVSCVNVSGLMLGRGFGRRHEVAVRLSLGASRTRLARQFLAETLLVSGLAAAVAIPVSLGALRLFGTLVPPQFTVRLQDAGIDARVLLFVLGIVLVSAALSGAIPALVLTRSAVNENLKSGASGSLGGRAGSEASLQRLLLAAEIGAAFVLLVGAILMSRTLWLTTHQRLGFDPRDVSSVSVIQTSAFQNREPWSGRTNGFEEGILRRARALPFVESASIGGVPFTGAPELPLVVGQTDLTRIEDMPVAYWWNVSPGFLRTLRIPLLQGRDFTNADGPDSQPVVLVNQKLADTYFYGASPLGKHLAYVTFDPSPQKVEAEVVGVVGNTKMAGLTWPTRPELYTCASQSALGGNLLVRSRVPLGTLAATMKEIVRDTGDDFGLESIKPVAQTISESSVAQPRILTILLLVFATLALGLTAVGVFGAVSFNVVRRTREIGIRIALGAQRGDVLRVILFHSLATTAIGLAAGIAASLVLARLIRAWLYGVAPDDWLTLVLSTVLLLLVCALASYIPARRATHVDPQSSLRYE